MLLPIAGNNRTWLDPKVEKNSLPSPVTSVWQKKILKGVSKAFSGKNDF